MPFVYDFDHTHRRPPMEMKDLLGGKGANLAEMTSVLELPVPHGFTITTDACRAYMEGGWPEGLSDEVARARGRLEKKMGIALGDGNDPLLVSVRSGAKFSMPGMMDTVLNLGLNDESVEGGELGGADGRGGLKLLAQGSNVVVGDLEAAGGEDILQEGKFLRRATRDRGHERLECLG